MSEVPLYERPTTSGETSGPNQIRLDASPPKGNMLPVRQPSGFVRGGGVRKTPLSTHLHSEMSTFNAACLSLPPSAPPTVPLSL